MKEGRTDRNIHRPGEQGDRHMELLVSNTWTQDSTKSGRMGDETASMSARWWCCQLVAKIVHVPA